MTKEEKFRGVIGESDLAKLVQAKLSVKMWSFCVYRDMNNVLVQISGRGRATEEMHLDNAAKWSRIT